MPPRDLGPAPQPLLAAWDDLLPELPALLQSITDVVPPARDPRPGDEEAQEQFVTAFTQVVQEGLEGERRDVRDLVFQTAVPAIVADGTTTPELVETHVALFALLQRALVSRLDDADRQAAVRWLAAYFGGYVRELVEIAVLAEERRG